MKPLYVIIACWYICISNAEDLIISSVDYPPITAEKLFDNIGYGVYRDLAEVIASNAGFTPTFIFKPYLRMAKDFGKTDDIGLISGRTLTSVGYSSNQLYRISLGYVYNHYFYFKSHLPNKIGYSKPSDLKGYSVCLQIGSYAAKDLINAGVRVQNVVHFQQCLKKLVLKRDDVWGTNGLTAKYYTHKLFPEKLPDLVHTGVSPRSRSELFIALTKNAKNKVILSRLESSFQTLKDNGVALNIINKYWNDQVPQRVLPLDMRTSNVH